MFLRKFFGHALVVALALCLLTPQFSLHSQENTSEDEPQSEESFKLSLEELMNVKITTAGKTAEKIADIPASVVLITRDDIEVYGYTTLTEILENIPGLYGIEDYSENGTNFGVRGFWSGVANDNMVILVNGVHQINDIYSNYPFNKIAVPVEAIDRIEVIRGPMSVVYGNGAFYGVINIITDDNSKEEVSIVSGAVGSEKTKRIFLRTAGTEGDFSYVFNASLYDTYGIDEALSDMVGDPSILPFFGVPVDSRTGGKLENNEKYINFSGTFNHFFLKLNYNESKREFYAPFPSTSFGSNSRNINTFISFGYKNQISEKLTVEGKFSYSQSRDWFTYDHLSHDFYGIEQLETNGYELEINSFFTPSDDLKISTGLYYRAVLNAGDMVDLPSFGVPFLENWKRYLSEDDNIITRAIFTQINYSPSYSLRLVAGVRLEQSPKYTLKSHQTFSTEPTIKDTGHYEEEKIEIIPRLATIYYINDHNILKFLFGKAINRPSFFQNLFNSLDEKTKGDLRPESIQTLELNYISLISPHVSLNISMFQNTLNNLITRVVKFDEVTTEYESWSSNAGKMITHGIELTLNVEPFDNLRMEFSGTYQKTKDKREGYDNYDVAYSPNFLGYLKAFYRTEKFSLAVTGNYVGAMEPFWDETRGNVGGTPKGSRIGDKVDGYFILGANLRLTDLFLEGLYLNVHCYNLLDEEIRYPNFTLNDYTTRGTIGHGRTFLLSVGYKW